MRGKEGRWEAPKFTDCVISNGLLVEQLSAKAHHLKLISQGNMLDSTRVNNEKDNIIDQYWVVEEKA